MEFKFFNFFKMLDSVDVIEEYQLALSWVDYIHVYLPAQIYLLQLRNKL
jgi:hypothetical protein